MALAVAVELDVVRPMMQVTSVAGHKGKHDPGRKGSRHGSEEGRVVLGGRKVPMERDQGWQGGQSRSYEAFQDENTVTQAVLERMIHGPRGYRHGLEPVGDGVEAVGTSKSSVSRHFVEATQKALSELLSRPLSDERYLALLLDGIEIADHTVVVGVGITSDGCKPSAAENTA